MTMNHRQSISYALLALITALSLYGCVGNTGTQPAHSGLPSSASAPAVNSPVPETPSPGLTSTTSPAISTDPRPGWTWHRSDAYSIAYPQQWLSQPAEGFPYGFSYQFTSPETGTGVHVTVLESIGATDWLEWLRNKKGMGYPARAVSANATFHGIPTFFFFDPGALQSGDIVRLYFEDRDRGWIYQITYRCMPGRLYAAENAIFTQMLSSFSLGNQDGPTTFPVDWADGDTLITYLSINQDLALDAPLLDITGTLADPGFGNYVIQSDGDQKVNASVALVHLFQGKAIDFSGPSPWTGIDQYDPIRIIATKTSSGRLVAHIVYRQDAAHNWQIGAYRSFFDLDQQPPSSNLLKHYPLDGSASLWLYSATIDKILPYLMTRPEAIGGVPANLPVLAHGSLRGTDPPGIDLDALYVQNGPCETIPLESGLPDGKSYPVPYCYNWQQVYPAPDPNVELTGEVLAASETDRVIVLKTPVNGFVTLTPSPDAAVDWPNLAPGATVKVKGQPGEAGTLVISQIEISPPG